MPLPGGVANEMRVYYRCMTKISSDEVRKLAHLSGISVSNDETERLQTELEAILNYVELLSELDTDGVKPTYQVTGLEHVTRPDEIIDYGVSQEQLMENAPDQKDGQFKVPKVLNNE